MRTLKRAHRILGHRIEDLRLSLGIGAKRPTREWYLIRIGVRFAIAAPLIGAWIHGIYWAGGLPGAHAWIMGFSNPNSKANAPLGLALIDFAPLWLAIAGAMIILIVDATSLLGETIGAKWRSLPSYKTQRVLVAQKKEAETRRLIAELDRERDRLDALLYSLHNTAIGEARPTSEESSVYYAGMHQHQA